ncbi:MAG TPA: DegT/DnrJ/EryC1/StrS family aminotransferase [Terriglobales bacterium]|nr:DegT/DnrJ/EryC1/StrS family aminotransferase [Terriglobales bacterium]
MPSALSNEYIGSSGALAINGGPRAVIEAFAKWPHYTESTIAAVAEILRSGRVNYWTGEEGERFEKEFAGYCGAKYGIAVANGSVALELALRSLGISPGDEVIVPSRTFIASATCVMVCGATPVFADVNLETQTLEIASVRKLISPRTKAIIAVHLAGWPCAMDELVALAKQHSIFVIEDCAQAHGARYKGQCIGSIGDIGTFSFCQDKIISTGGEGGMVVTNNASLWERMWSYKDHGRNFAMSKMRGGTGFRWIHDSFGSNFRMTEMQSAIGRMQLHSLDEQLAIRRYYAWLLTQRFTQIPGLRVPVPSADVQPSYYRFYAFVEAERLATEWNRDRALEAICAEGVPCGVGSCSEIYLERAFPVSMRPTERLRNARRLAETSLAFPVHPTLTETNIRQMCDAVEKVMNAATYPHEWHSAA